MSLKHCLYFINVERDLYSKLAERDLLEDPSLTYDGLMKLSEEILPSTILETGGFMFKLFVLRFGIERYRKAMSETKMDSKTQTEIIKR